MSSRPYKLGQEAFNTGLSTGANPYAGEILARGWIKERAEAARMWLEGRYDGAKQELDGLIDHVRYGGNGGA